MTDGSPLGGIFQWHQAKVLKKYCKKVNILTLHLVGPRLLFKQISKKVEVKDGIFVYRFYYKSLLPIRYMKFERQLEILFKKINHIMDGYIALHGKPDIIHAHNFLYAGLIANYLKEKYGINYIVTEHSSSFFRSKLFALKIESIRQSAKNALKTTAVSFAFQKVLKQYINTEIDLLSNTVDSFFFQNDFKSNENDRFVFLNIASLDKNKNQELLIKSFEKLAKLNNKIYLNIAGDGYIRNYLENLVKELNIEKQVNFLGRISQERVRDEMMQSDCFVLSSNFETFGVVLIEALACGLPLIATKCGGPEDIVNEQNGILIDVENQLQLENAMFTMYKNVNKYDKDKLRNYAKDRFGEDTFIKNVMKYYELGINSGK